MKNYHRLVIWFDIADSVLLDCCDVVTRREVYTQNLHDGIPF